MRLLVQCPHCKRQYNAGRRSVGSRFRCHCGHLVQVQQPQGHDARVVRCSSCGAPRTENSDVCPYCQAEFTLHERDLNTVCPNCLARVSDSARFCHHCGTGLVPELDAGEDTELLCPSCPGEHRLVSRRLGPEQFSVLECGRCGGFWLGHEAFQQLVERALHEALPFGTQGPLAPGSAGKGLQQHRRGRFYRPCVVCGKLMNRFNYGRVSGVIIDACKDHGIWFEAGALSRILDWVHKGGAEVTAGEEEYLRQEEARRAEKLERHEKARTGDTFVQPRPPHHFLHSLLEPLLRHGEKGGRIKTQTITIVDRGSGSRQVFHSLDELPSKIRAELEEAQATGKVVTRSIFTYLGPDGRKQTYYSLDDMPADRREAYEKILRKNL